MGLAVNISLIVMATIIGMCAITYFFGETVNWHHQRFMLLLGLFALLWCVGYAIMGLTGDRSLAYFWRSLGLLGAILFAVTYLNFAARISGAFTGYWRIVFSLLYVPGIADWLLFSRPGNVILLRSDYRTRFYAVTTGGRIFHGIFTILLCIALIVLFVRRYSRASLRRDKRIVWALSIAILVLLLCCLPDLVLPLWGFASFPGSCYGVFLCYLTIWFVSTRLNAFNLSVRNLSSYIYQYVGSSVLVFDDQLHLSMANRHAHEFLDITEDVRPGLNELFQISKEDTAEIYEQLLKDKKIEDLRLVANNNLAVCSLHMNVALDSYGDPYGTVCFVYDLTKEENILSEVNSMKEVLQENLREKTYQVESLTLQAITTIANTIDAKDAYTKGHSIRVSEYSALLAKTLGWNQEAIQNLKYVALLHDIGKISVPDSILNKPDKLTDTEYEIIKSHTIVGGDILKDITMIKDVADGAKHHHERYDGHGYPDGLAGEEIPLIARIICIADAYDAMNSKRVYRRPLPESAIREELVRGRGSQFDPFLLDQFLGLFDNGLLSDYAEKDSSDTIVGESTRLLDQILHNLEQEKEKDSQCDYLTGLLSRKYGEAKIIEAMSESPGALAFVDLDNLKVINDTMGHLSGDHAIKALADVLNTHSRGAIITRIGGDEFLYYMINVTEKEARATVEGIIHSFRSKKEDDAILTISSLSIGICMTSPNDKYAEAYQRADKALYYVKQNGKDNYYLYSPNQTAGNMTAVDLKKLVQSLSRQGAYEGSLGVEYREFTKFYEYIGKLTDRYEQGLQLIMLTLEPLHPETFTLDNQEEAMSSMSSAINGTLRNVDISTRFSSEQFLIILFDADKENVEMITRRIFDRFYKLYTKENISLSYDIADLAADEIGEQKK
ncbi:MAG: diguanylate cyclase [Blautia sp.]|nr:diguanylate cyclase [Blautia sp.]